MKSLFLKERLSTLWERENLQIICDPDKPQDWVIFSRHVKNLTNRLLKSNNSSWVLYTEEPGEFAVAFLALLYSGKNIHLPGVRPESSITTSGLPVLSDEKISLMPILTESPVAEMPMLNSLDFTKQKIIFHTSGSTGEPKMVVKELFRIEEELRVLSRLWGSVIKDTIVYSTVSHQHFYGILFSILLPLASGVPIASKKLHFPESLYSLIDKKITLISSPAFLKRLSPLDKSLNRGNNTISIFSSGGFLPVQTAEFCEKFFDSKIHEIYGSTETGGVAWKDSPGDGLWTPFEVVKILTEKKGGLKIRSPYLEKDNTYILDDKIIVSDNGLFELCGRRDSIVKIEEKRVALNDIENRILETKLVTDVAVIALENSRQYIAAVIELNDLGKQKFAGSKKKDINLFFRNYLSAFFHPTVLPKKWRYPLIFPVNTQGKILRNEIVHMFEKPVDNPDIISESEIENGWIYEILFPKNYRYFDGHFPEMKILPAVVQVDWVMKKVEEKTGMTIHLERIPRLKFNNPIFPEKKVNVKIIYKPETLKISFEYRSSDTEKQFSSGNIYLKETFN
ncbi:MAG: AMP-binding protein [Spirochaetaceae bacterium]|jgi:hypothetical protein|nr:AMP-binding protein [Spirochaetaceae bacterium]